MKAALTGTSSRHLPLPLQISSLQCCTELLLRSGRQILLKTLQVTHSIFIQLFQTDENMVVSAPTGAGKTGMSRADRSSIPEFCLTAYSPLRDWYAPVAEDGQEGSNGLPGPNKIAV